MQLTRYYATGKRKRAVARVYIHEDSQSNFVVNDRTFDEYFKEAVATLIVNQPFELTNTKGKFSVSVNVCGGGISSQAEAIRHGISKALLVYDANLRPVLKKKGLLTRDSREVERKKYGKSGARKRYQFSKR